MTATDNTVHEEAPGVQSQQNARTARAPPLTPWLSRTEPSVLENQQRGDACLNVHRDHRTRASLKLMNVAVPAD
jgi:hypothetical protein